MIVTLQDDEKKDNRVIFDSKEQGRISETNIDELLKNLKGSS